MFKSTCQASQKRSFLSLPDLDAIAHSCGLVMRKSSKFTPSAFLQTLLGSVATGLASLNQLAGSLKNFTHSAMARQSFHQRFNTSSTAFLVAVLSDLTEKRFQPATAALRTGPIKRIFIEDASAQAMPKSNAKLFPAHGNHHGSTAGLKVDFAFDLLTGQILSHTLHTATEQDKTIGKECLTQVSAGDLVLRDMGYFVLSEFDEIERKNAFWLTRLPLSVGVMCGKGETLETMLKHSRHDVLDVEVLVGDVQKKCRFIAVRATPEVAKARRAQRRKIACESGKKPCPKGIERDRWHLMLTNLSKEEASVSQLTAVYRARWAVEIQFRGWKQALNLGKALNRKSNEHHMQALMLAAMIAHQLGMRVGARISELAGRAKLSYEKLYDLYALHLIKAKDISELCAFEPELRHVTRDKRTRPSPVESGINALN
jgi:hypothetical protein